MHAGYELLQRWKTLKKLSSDNAAAAALGTSRQTISHWKTGENRPRLEQIRRMAKDLGIPSEGFELAIESERASTPELSDLLARIAKKFPPFAAALILAFGITKSAQCHNVTSVNFDISTAEYTYALAEWQAEVQAACAYGSVP
jgi:transcriptional regulator with XRE-family HTH domain